MEDKREIARRLYGEGLTYKEVGERLGVSKARAHVLVNKPSQGYFNKMAIDKVRYIGLREWMIKNKVTMSELERRCRANRMYHNLVYNHKPNKKTIDAILSVTGLTYDECFKEDSKV